MAAGRDAGGLGRLFGLGIEDGRVAGDDGGVVVFEEDLRFLRGRSGLLLLCVEGAAGEEGGECEFGLNLLHALLVGLVALGKGYSIVADCDYLRKADFS